MPCIHCGYQAMYWIRQLGFESAKSVCERCIRDYCDFERDAAELIPLCEGTDDDGDPCQERPGERLCAHCREQEAVPA